MVASREAPVRRCAVALLLSPLLSPLSLSLPVPLPCPVVWRRPRLPPVRACPPVAPCLGRDLVASRS
eukprot:3379179-Prymnesium_polylepis.1